MTRRILTALAAITLVLLAFGSPYSAQEHQVGARSQESSRVMDVAETEQFRSELIAAYTESEALIKFLASYDFIRHSVAMEDFEAVCLRLETERMQIERMSAQDLTLQAKNLPESKLLRQIIEVSRNTRTDARFLDVVQKAQRFSQANAIAKGTPTDKRANSRGAVSAPAYIPPICNHDDPSNYPSGTDLAISNGVAIGLHALADALPGLLGFFVGVPNPVKIALVVAAYAVDQVTNALAAVAADAVYCESTRLYIEDNLVNDDGYTAILITNDFYLTFMLKVVRSALTKATNTGIPTNCGSTRLTEALTYFNGSDVFNGANGADRVSAYNKLRAAYQNIGASSCVQ